MPRPARPAAATTLSTLLLLAAVPVAAETAPRFLDDATYMEMEDVQEPKISPDGRLVVFTRTWVDQKTDRYPSNLWIVDTAGERIRELTHGDWSDSAPVFSPDGTRLAFLSDRDGSEQIHVLWLDTREVAQLTRLEHTPQDVRWSPDGKRLAFTLFVPDETPPLAIELPKAPKGAERAAPAVVVDRMTWARDGRGYLPPGYLMAGVDAALEYAARSPLTYAPNVTTPTLVMTGEADLRTPMSQSEEYYRALKMLRKETLLIRVPEEYHGWRRPSHRLAQQLYLRAWFDKYRTDREEEGGVPEVKRGDTRPGASR